MRKWILHWLLGSDAKSWHDMFAIACECRVDCNRLLKSSESLLEEYKDLADEYIAVLNALKDATDLFYLKMKVLEICNATKEKKMNNSQSEQLEV